MYLELVLVFLCAVFCFELLLNVRQYIKYNEKRPLEIQSFCDEEKYKKANSYGKDKMKLNIVSQFFSFLQSYAFLIYGGKKNFN